ncbi:MAG: redoxin domain-containing protein [Planctomycetota bacterium]
MFDSILALLTSTVLGASPFAAQDAPAAEQEEEVPKVFQVDKPVDLSLALPALDGKVHTLKQYLGKTVVVDFWSIACPISIAYEGRMKALYARYKDDPQVVLLAIDANHTELAPGEDPYARIKKYVADEKIPFPILIDAGNVVADRFGAQTTPHVFVIDAKGYLRYAGAVDDDPGGKKKPEEVKQWAADAIAALRAGEPVAVKTTKPVGCTIKRVPKETKADPPAEKGKIDG